MLVRLADVVILSVLCREQAAPNLLLSIARWSLGGTKNPCESSDWLHGCQPNNARQNLAFQDAYGNKNILAHKRI